MRINGKKAFYLLDKFSFYKLAIELLKEANSFMNTKVNWLPLNATLIYQPLDQRII
jgi:hypothetical protein